VVVDSKEQAARFGNTFHAIQAGFINIEKTGELGDVIQKGIPSHSNLIITDLTGIAAQDIAIAEWVLMSLDKGEKCD
jgi:ornithine cyclodeaminase/alanine dehydrogenase-like protein (mu-crystallin family)